MSKMNTFPVGQTLDHIPVKCPFMTFCMHSWIQANSMEHMLHAEYLQSIGETPCPL